MTDEILQAPESAQEQETETVTCCDCRSEVTTSETGYSECYHCDQTTCTDCNWNVNGETVCDRCRSEHYVLCESCEDTIAIDDSHYADDRYYCESCFNDNYSSCADCGDTTHHDDLYSVNGDSSVCRGCRDDHYFSCQSCGDLEHYDNSYNCEHCECHYCAPCIGDHEETCSSRRRGINLREHARQLETSGKNAITDYHPKVDWEFLTDKKDLPNNPFIGIELELEANRDNDSLDNACRYIGKNLAGKVICSHDGSLTYGTEMVFTPMKREMLRQVDFKKICKGLARRGMTSFHKATCGLHVHIERRGYLKKQRYFKGRWWSGAELYQQFYIKLHAEIKRFSKRKDKQIKLYCEFKTSKDFDKNYDGERHPRYSAVNLCNKNTVEVRIWRGTLEHERLKANILFSLAVLDFLQAHSTAIIMKSRESKLINLFHDWLETSGEYQTLVKYLRKKKLFNFSEPIKQAELNSLPLFNESITL